MCRTHLVVAAEDADEAAEIAAVEEEEDEAHGHRGVLTKSNVKEFAK